MQLDKEKIIPNPSIKEVKKYLNLWDDLENYVLQESSLTKLFTKTYPKNTDIDDILIKVSSLNDFYSTNIFSPFSIAKHILSIDIDKRLKNNDLSLVNDLALVKIKNKEKNFYSFATKYCSHHKPEEYPIYDSFVEKVIFYFSKKDDFTSVLSGTIENKRKKVKNYTNFKKILNDFRIFYKLDGYSLKDIDKYLWQLGKEYFPKKY